MFTKFEDYLNESDTQYIANEIRKQIGHKALELLGAINYGYGETKEGKPYLSFKIRGSKKVSHIKIELNSMDTYDITFMKIGKDIKIVNKVEGVYNDMLHKIIEENTGLYTHL